MCHIVHRMPTFMTLCKNLIGFGTTSYGLFMNMYKCLHGIAISVAYLQLVCEIYLFSALSLIEEKHLFYNKVTFFSNSSM